MHRDSDAGYYDGERGLGMAGSVGMGWASDGGVGFSEKDHVTASHMGSSGGSTTTSSQSTSGHLKREKDGKNLSLLFHKIGSSNPKDKDKEKNGMQLVYFFIFLFVSNVVDLFLHFHSLVTQPASAKQKKRTSSGQKSRADIQGQSYASFHINSDTGLGAGGSNNATGQTSSAQPHTSTSPTGGLSANAGGEGASARVDGKSNNRPCPCCGHETNINAEPVLQRFDMTNFNCVICGELTFQDDSDIVANIIPIERRKKVHPGYVPFIQASGLSRQGSVNTSTSNSPVGSPKGSAVSTPKSAQRNETAIGASSTANLNGHTLAMESTTSATTTTASSTTNGMINSENVSPMLNNNITAPLTTPLENVAEAILSDSQRHASSKVSAVNVTAGADESVPLMTMEGDVYGGRESRKDRRKSRAKDEQKLNKDGVEVVLLGSKKVRGEGREEDVNETEGKRGVKQNIAAPILTLPTMEVMGNPGHEKEKDLLPSGGGSKRKSDRKKRSPLSPRSRRSKSTEKREDKMHGRRDTVDIVVDEGLDLRRKTKDKPSEKSSGKKQHESIMPLAKDDDEKARSREGGEVSLPRSRSHNPEQVGTIATSRDSHTTTTTTNSNSNDDLLSSSNNNFSRSGSTALEAKERGGEEGANLNDDRSGSVDSISAHVNYSSSNVFTSDSSTNLDLSLSQSHGRKKTRNRSLSPPLSPRSSAKHKDSARSKSGKRKAKKQNAAARDGYQRTANATTPNGSVSPDDSEVEEKDLNGWEENGHEQKNGKDEIIRDEVERKPKTETQSTTRPSDTPFLIPPIIADEDPACRSNSALAPDDSLLDKPPTRPSPIRPSLQTSSSQIVMPQNTLHVPSMGGSISASRDNGTNETLEPRISNAPTSTLPTPQSTPSITTHQMTPSSVTQATLAAQVLLQQQFIQQHQVQQLCQPASLTPLVNTRVPSDDDQLRSKEVVDEIAMEEENIFISYDSFKRQLRKINSGRFGAVATSSTGSESPKAMLTHSASSVLPSPDPQQQSNESPNMARVSSLPQLMSLRAKGTDSETQVIVNSENEEVEIITTLKVKL
jgi:hypothetical protein